MNRRCLLFDLSVVSKHTVGQKIGNTDFPFLTADQTSLDSLSFSFSLTNVRALNQL